MGSWAHGLMGSWPHTWRRNIIVCLVRIVYWRTISLNHALQVKLWTHIDSIAIDLFVYVFWILFSCMRGANMCFVCCMWLFVMHLMYSTLCINLFICICILNDSIESHDFNWYASIKTSMETKYCWRLTKYYRLKMSIRRSNYVCVCACVHVDMPSIKMHLEISTWIREYVAIFEHY